MNIDLRDLDGRILAKMVDYGRSELAYAANREIQRRQRPRHHGPVVVRLGGGNYAFNSPFAVAIGDRVLVDTQYGVQEGQVYAYGTGRWDPRQHGPLRSVTAVLS